MSLSFHGPRGTIEQRWIYYALLRDNVQHHIEGGKPSGEFECLHEISHALMHHRVTVSAKKLHDELIRAHKVLMEMPSSELAISLRTRAVLSLRPPPDSRETELVRDWGGTIPLLGKMRPQLADVFGHLLEQLLTITEGATDTDEVTIIDL
ncbi:MAG: hypothetical protein R3B70_34165 [Polyangiaceae bacterium]